MDSYYFHKTRIILTAWYVAILAVILFAFSFVLYTGEQRDFVRIIVQRDFNSRIPRLLSDEEKADVANQLVAIRRAFLFNLLVVDGLVLLVGGGLSYFLAGKTLSPIQKTFLKQKEFLADVSHEIRTPLAAIQTATEVSLRTTGKSKEEYKKVLGQVNAQTQRLTKMANDLMLLSRMETLQTNKFTRVSLAKLIKEAIGTLHASAVSKHISIVFKNGKSTSVFGDTQELLQLIIIFLDNAIKYTKENGTIIIGLKQHPKPTIVFEDSGIGISKENLQRIFERFYQEDASRSQTGSGLGLAIAREILLRHKAKIDVASTLGKGTTFTIIFPE
ncbi:MAG TPA: ATP-binding protein [Patescibacteria group bacterium]|nr:ATP-binding protein [Patescibacteria group bacterium]